MRHATLTAALTLIALSFTTGCGSNVHDGVNMKKKVGFGAVVPNTGPCRLVGAELYRGMLVAEHTLNASGGVDGKEVKVVVYDSTGEPEKGLDFTRILTRDFEVPFLAVALPRVVDKTTPEYVDHGTLAERIEGGDAPAGDGERTLRTFLSGADEARLMAETATKEKLSKVLVLAADDRYGEFAARTAIEELKKSGATRADRLPLLKQALALENIEDAVRKNGYDAVFIFGHGPEIPPALLSLRRAGHTGEIFGNHAFGGKTVTMIEPTMIAKVRFTAPAFLTADDRPMSTRFREEYRRLNREEPDLFAAFGYDQVMLVFTAAKNEDSVSPRAVRRNILGRKTYDGAAGTYSFDENGSATLALSLIPVREAVTRNTAVVKQAR